MIKEKVFLLIRKYKKLSAFLFLLIFYFFYIKFSLIFYHTTFIISNKTGYNLVYKVPELPNSDNPDPYLTEIEDDSMQYFYHLKNQREKTVADNEKYWGTSGRFLGLFFGIDYTYNFKPAGFIDTPTYPNQKPSCSFKIEVYSDRTVVTPTYKKFCKKPMYHYEDFNPYNPAHQPKSY